MLKTLFRLPRSRALPAWAKATVSAGIATSLAGCMAVNFPDLGLDVPSRYEAAPRSAEVSIPQIDWWKSFHSPELTQLIDAAELGNLDIAAAVARIQQADAALTVSGATLFPTVSGDASGTRSKSAGGRDHNSFDLGLSASYEIDLFGKNRANRDAARANALGSRYDKDTIVLSTTASIATTYLHLVGTQDRVRIANEDVSTAQRILKLIQDRVSVGTATQLDLAQQQSIIAQQKASIAPLEQAIEQDQIALAVLLGRAPAHVDVRGGKLSSIRVPRVTPGLPSSLLMRRPDIRSAEEQLEAAHFSVVAARAAFFPSIQLTGSSGFESAALSSLFNAGGGFYSIAAGLTQPIFDGQSLKGQFAQAKGVEAEKLAAYRSAVISAFSDVEKALVAIRQLGRQASGLQDVVASSRQAYQLSEAQLREGTINLVTLLQTQQTLFQAQDSLVQVRLSQIQAVVALIQALGGGFDGSAAPGQARG